MYVCTVSCDVKFLLIFSSISSEIILIFLLLGLLNIHFLPSVTPSVYLNIQPHFSWAGILNILEYRVSLLCLPFLHHMTAQFQCSKTQSFDTTRTIRDNKLYYRTETSSRTAYPFTRHTCLKWQWNNGQCSLIAEIQ